MVRQQTICKGNTANHSGMIHGATGTEVESLRKAFIREWYAW